MQRAVFVHIQKTGGESIRAALDLPRMDPNKHRMALELREIVGADEWERSFTFGFVRNPWDRLASWWTMIDRMRAQARNPFQRYVADNATTFREFILRCTDTIEDADGSKSIVRPQIDYLTDDGNLIVDFVGRYERLADDFATVCARLGAEASLPHVNASGKSDFRGFYDDELTEIVGERFASDIEAFDYSF